MKVIIVGPAHPYRGGIAAFTDRLATEFVAEDVENYFIDVNKTLKDKVRSILMHVIFTPKGQKLRDPEFGTDLIRYIFEPNDNISWEGIKAEITEIVNKYVQDYIIITIFILMFSIHFSNISNKNLNK